MQREVMSKDAVRTVIGIGGLAGRRGGTIVTHALGSCLGLCAIDRTAHVGAMIHSQLPVSAKNPQRAAENPALFTDLALGLVLAEAEREGADRRRLRLCLAGGANVNAVCNVLFNIAKQNLTVMRKVLWQASMLLDAEDTGGTAPRTVFMNLDTGVITIESAGKRTQL